MIPNNIRQLIAPEWAKYIPEHPALVYSTDERYYEIIRDLTSVDNIPALPDLDFLINENIVFDEYEGGEVHPEEWSNWFQMIFEGEIFYLHLTWTPSYEEEVLMNIQAQCYFTGELEHFLTQDLMDILRKAEVPFIAYQVRYQFETLEF